MNNSVSSRKLEVKCAEVAIEYGTLALLMESLFQQPVLVMPLERSILQGSVAIYQWAGDHSISGANCWAYKESIPNRVLRVSDWFGMLSRWAKQRWLDFNDLLLRKI